MQNTRPNAERVSSKSLFFSNGTARREHLKNRTPVRGKFQGPKKFGQATCYAKCTNVRRKCQNMVNVSAEGQVFVCEICGNVVVVKEVGGGELICCGEPMKLQSK